MQEKLASDIFGFSKETIEASKNIYPTFELVHKRRDGTIVLDIGTEIDLTFETDPKLIETKDNFGKKGATKKSAVAVVEVHEVRRPQKGTTEKLVVPMNRKYSLWLSSRSLQMSLAGALGDRTSWIGFRCVITVDTADYEQGENTAYRVEAVSE